MRQTASVVYWHDEQNLLRDGGGLRALAWLRALRDLGFDAEIHPVHAGIYAQSGVKTRPLTKLKRLIAPMPFSRRIEVPQSDLVVGTVPGVFQALSRLHTGQHLVFDWMDRWSQSSRSMGYASLLSMPGGFAQSATWALREPRLVRASDVNTFASYADACALRADSSFWLPTPASGHDTASGRSSLKIETVGFLANFNYEPNLMSLRWFIRKYMKEFLSRGIRILIAGYGSDKLTISKNGLEIVGPVDNLSTFYENIDAALVPVRHGGGIKVKAVEALLHGVPVLCTPHVREGFAPEFASQLWLIDDFLLDDTKRPVTDPKLLRHFSQESFSAKVAQILEGGR